MDRKARGFRCGLPALICLFAASLGLFVLTACGGHQHTLTFVAGTEATCEEAGSPAHWTCADCGKNFADEAGTEELTSLVLPALGHDWDEGAETTPASCETPGVRTYTCSRCQDTYTEDIAPLEHDWDTENIVWSWEGTASASTQISCKNGDHPQTLTAEVSSQQTQDPTDTAEGERTFTATVTFEGRTYTDQKTESIPRLSLAYALNDDQGSYTVTGMGTVTGTSVTVPDTHEGLPVTAVAAGAFRNAAITQITLSVNVTAIGADAFAGCEALEVTYGGTLADWAAIDFENASANPLNGGSLVIGGEKVTDPVLPDSVTEIKPYAFAGATFVSITLNVSVVVIGAGAFEGADLGDVNYGGSIADWVDIDFENASANPLNGGSLVIGGEQVTDLVIPAGVTAIKPFAFAGATFVSITLNVSVTVIGAGAFEGADLGEVRYGGSIADWVGIDFENASANPLNGGSLVIGGEKVSDLVIPEGVTEIKPFAFAGATFVSVTLNVTVTVIGDSAFENCTVSASVSFTGTAEDWEKVDVGGENGLLEEVSCHTHSYQSEVTKDPTCTEEGVRTFTCSCGDSYTEPVAMDPNAHTPEVIPAVPATCTETGLTEGSRCSGCGKILVEQEEVPVTDHQYESEVTKEPTCTEEGLQTYTCSGCGDSYTEPVAVDPDAHTPEVIPAVSATCTETGLTEGSRCSGCGKILVEQEEVPMIAHNYVGGACTMCGEPEKWTGDVAEAFESGTGTRYDPYIIASPAQLAFLAKSVSEGTTYSNRYFRLANDIDLGGREWTPIGQAYATRFIGTFDGDGHTISNFKITATYDENAYVGLFGYIRENAIQNLGVTEFVIEVSGTANLYVGGLAGHLYRTNLENCYASGTITCPASSATIYAGGLFGYQDADNTSAYSVKNCHADVLVTVSGNSACAGGLAGYLRNVPLSDSHATGSVTAVSSLGNCDAGGLIGDFGEAPASGCYATGAVRADGKSVTYAGGLFGFGYDLGTLSDCYATGSVDLISSGSCYGGGLLGRANLEVDVARCYATGEVQVTASGSAQTSAGGLIGDFDSGSFVNCYAWGNVTAQGETGELCAGGLVGDYYSINLTSLSACYATGNVTASTTTGRLEVGGLIGGFYSREITNSFATGNVTASSDSGYVAAGGFAAGSNTAIQNCHRNEAQILTVTVAGEPGTPSTYGTAQTLADLQSEAFLTGTLKWSSSVWNFEEGEFPTLK